MEIARETYPRRWRLPGTCQRTTFANLLSLFPKPDAARSSAVGKCRWPATARSIQPALLPNCAKVFTRLGFVSMAGKSTTELAATLAMKAFRKPKCRNTSPGSQTAILTCRSGYTDARANATL